MLNAVAFPCFGTRVAPDRNGPQAPHFFARVFVPCGQKTARSLFAAGGSRNHEIAYDQRRGRGVVVLLPVGHFHVPRNFPIAAIQRKQMRVVGHHVDPIARKRDAAVHTTRRIAHEAARAGP